MSKTLLGTPQPYYLPGYAGHCPEYQYVPGKTYGAATHKVLVDPSTVHSDRLVLADQTFRDYKVKNVPEGHEESSDTDEENQTDETIVYKDPMLPGYAGHMPQSQYVYPGKSFNKESMKGISKFKQEQHEVKKKRSALEKAVEILDGSREATVSEKKLLKSDYKLPLVEIRPDLSSMYEPVPIQEPLRKKKSDKDTLSNPWRAREAPVFMDKDDPQKFFVKGYDGHVPFGHSTSGLNWKAQSTASLCDFTAQYRQNKSTEWAPVSLTRVEPPIIIRPSEIYHKHLGMLPNYSGHIPGIQFSYGKTFGQESKDAKRVLRGHQ